MSELVFVGTSDAFGSGGRRQSAMLLRAPSGALLLDCGVTTNTGLSQLGLEREEIDAIAISHFHGDHFGGLPLLLLAALYEDERRRPLVVAGPPGVEHRVRELARAMGHGLEDRPWPFELSFRELTPGGSHDLGPARLHPFEARHQPDSNPQGFVVESGARRLAFSGDTGWFDELPRQVAGTDLFVTECTFRERQFEYHLNYETLADQRDRFDCGRIVLTHLGAEMTDLRGACEFETADDGLVVAF